MNEVTWQHVLAWEALHAGECGQPQLLRFCGRPDELRYGLQADSTVESAAFKQDSEFSTEAGLKYFLLGVFSSGLLLFGCSLIYGFTRVVEFSNISKNFAFFAFEHGQRGAY